MPGIGKTTSIHCLAHQLLGDAYKEGVLELNASDERCATAVIVSYQALRIVQRYRRRPEQDQGLRTEESYPPIWSPQNCHSRRGR